ncbi:uncharacterized protein LOC116195654 isoform X2 [Punica granatum]|nr:uncharacterized protein LOC116195654 isoform X2 [Punica granatum]XP_031380810.1 uncharacterized protein LOC116195654 isoform X2 [Punica granatum]OWM78956.1 hypothetical protein CDL15_Pgr003127 [Punica granatum]PKI42873.1 hypothetical protein CRG98_036671 [Punica granatum]
MGRVRGKGKKQTVAAREDPGSGEEEKIPVYRKRGRPQKIVKDYTEEDSADKVEENGEGLKDSISAKDMKNEGVTENGRKRVRSAQAKENIDSVKEENGIGAKTGANDIVKPVGFRQNGNRRKNKPRRAAEVGVECK